MTRASRLAPLIALGALLAAAPAGAGNKDQALYHYKQGEEFVFKKQYERAVIEFEEAYKLDPDYQILKKIAETEENLGNHKAAIAAYQRYLQEGGKRIDKKERRSVEAEIEQISSAVSQMASRDQAVAHFKEGTRLFNQGQYERAAIEFDRAYNLDPNPQILHSVGQVETKLTNYGRAINAYTRYLKEMGKRIKPDVAREVNAEIARLRKLEQEKAGRSQAQAHFNRGVAFFDKGQFARASHEFDEAYKLDPNFQILYRIGRAEVALENYPKALDAYTAFLKKGGRNIPRAQRAEVEREIGRLKALSAKRDALEKERKHFEAGLTLYNQGRFEKAVAEFEAAYAINKNYEFLFNIGQAQTAIRSFPKAIDAYTTYLKRGGNQITAQRRGEVKQELARLKNIMSQVASKQKAKVHYDKGIGLYKAGQFGKAIAEFDLAYRMDPSYEILYNIGQAQVKLKQLPQALSTYARFLNEGGGAVPSNRRAEVEREIARIQDLSEREGRRQKAGAFVSQGVAFYKKGAYTEALDAFKQAYTVDDDPAILLHVGKTQAALGNYDKAVASLERCLRDGSGRLSPADKAAAVKEMSRIKGLFGTLLVRSSVSGAEVTVDDQPYDLSTPIVVAAGSHNVVVKKEGNAFFAKAVQVNGGSMTTIQAEEEEDLPERVESAAGEIGEEGLDLALGEGEEEEPAEEGEQPERIWTWVAGGVGLAALAGGVVTGALALSKESDVRDQCPDGQCPIDKAESLNDEINTVDNLALTTDILLAVGAAGVVAGVILFFFEGSGEESVTVAPATDGETAGIFVSGTF